MLINQISPTPIATEPPAELIEQAVRVIDVWSTLGPLMAVLGLAALALLAILVVVISNRNTNASAIHVLTNSNVQKDKELDEAKAQREQDRRQHLESIGILSAQFTRSNDLWEASNNRGGERDKQQQRMVESQAQIVSDLKTMVSVGSAPVQEIKAKVGEIFGIVTHLDTRTADWNGILNVITPLLIELGALRTEAKKHSTQPIPVIDPPPTTSEASPS